MKRVIAVAAVAALGLSVAVAYADQNDGGFYVGVKGGYNNMKLPTGTETVQSTSNVELKKDKYVLNAHVGYLYPVADQFLVGGQVGGSYYGAYKMASSSGSTKVSFASINLYAVGQYNIEQWFVQGRVGAGYFIDDMGKNAASLNNTYKEKWLAIAGASVGYFFTDNLSAELFYDHAFGKNMKLADINDGSAEHDVPAMDSVGIGVSYIF